LLLRDTLRFLLYVLYCVEGGLFLTIVPWTWMWPQNYFFARFPWLGEVGMRPVTRGLVSGLGVALALHGASEILRSALRGGRPPARDRREGER
jgi:hypothetical protein